MACPRIKISYSNDTVTDVMINETLPKTSKYHPCSISKAGSESGDSGVESTGDGLQHLHVDDLPGTNTIKHFQQQSSIHTVGILRSTLASFFKYKIFYATPKCSSLMRTYYVTV